MLPQCFITFVVFPYQRFYGKWIFSIKQGRTYGGVLYLKNSLHNTNSSFMEHNTLFDIFIRYCYWKRNIQIFDNILNNTNFKKPFTKGKNVAFLYLGALILIYLFLFLFNGLYKNISLFNNKKLYYMFLLWGIAILCSVTMQTFSVFRGESIQQHIIQTFRLWSWIQYFILGGLIPHIQPVLIKKVSKKQHLFLFCMTSMFIVWYQYTISNHILNIKFAEYFYDSIFIISWVFILFTFILRLHISSKWNKYISVFCPLTLGVYIVHPLVISIIVGKLNCIPNYPTAICSFIAVLIVSFTGVWALNNILFIKKYLFTL